MNSAADLDRKPRFALDPAVRRPGQRATSQPARNDDSEPAAPLLPQAGSPRDRRAGNGYSNNTNNWGSPLRAEVGDPSWSSRSIPIRSASFSVSETHPHPDPTGGRLGFPSTFEDEEEDEDDPRRYQADDDGGFLTPREAFSRSRSQSMANEAALRAHSMALPLPGSSGLARNWGDRVTDTYGEYILNGHSRHPSLSPVRRTRTGQEIDMSNMSPFVRDVSQILNDDSSPVRETWVTLGGGAVNWREDNGGGSGTTSRRHSVSVVQPRRAVTGFVVPDEGGQGHSGDDGDDREDRRIGLGTFGTGSLRISDEDLISGLSALNLHQPPPPSSRNNAPPHPSSLPTYPPYNTYGTSPELSYSGGSARDEAFVSPTRPSMNRSLRSMENARAESYHDEAPSMHHSGQEYSYQQTFGVPLGPQALPRIQTGLIPSAGRLPLSPTGASYQRSGHQLHYTPTQTQHRHRHDGGNPTSPTLSDLGKGVPLHAVPESDRLYIVEFKAGRTDIFFCPDPLLHIRVGDLVIVEADRGKDLGKVVNDTITLADVEAFLQQVSDPTRSFQPALAGTRDAYLYAALSGPLSASSGGPMSPTVPGATRPMKEIMPKRIYAKAQPQETQLLVSKMHDEAKALQLCQNKVRQKRLPMQVVDAEFQWDRRKLTFYFTADKRIDFRELVRELFRLYKTRIWMACLGENVGDFVN